MYSNYYLIFLLYETGNNCGQPWCECSAPRCK